MKKIVQYVVAAAGTLGLAAGAVAFFPDNQSVADAQWTNCTSNSTGNGVVVRQDQRPRYTDGNATLVENWYVDEHRRVWANPRYDGATVHFPCASIR